MECIFSRSFIRWFVWAAELKNFIWLSTKFDLIDLVDSIVYRTNFQSFAMIFIKLAQTERVVQASHFQNLAYYLSQQRWPESLNKITCQSQ